MRAAYSVMYRVGLTPWDNGAVPAAALAALSSRCTAARLPEESRPYVVLSAQDIVDPVRTAPCH